MVDIMQVVVHLRDDRSVWVEASLIVLADANL